MGKPGADTSNDASMSSLWWIPDNTAKYENKDAPRLRTHPRWRSGDHTGAQRGDVWQLFFFTDLTAPLPTKTTVFSAHGADKRGRVL